MTDGMSGKDATVFCSTAAELLQSGKSVRFSAPGYSMVPVIMPSDVLHVAPIRAGELSIGDIALYHAGSRIIAHRVVDINPGKLEPNSPLRKSNFPPTFLGPKTYLSRFSPQGTKCRSSRRAAPLLKRSAPSASPSGEPPLQIILKGDACSTPDPPVTAMQILGKVIGVERHGHPIDPYRISCTLYSFAYRFLSRLSRFFR
jgi:hypothetical protein